jgi:DMSO/TMAO reductase YedYZ molybdopterin-dependent catalytic subunit
MSTEQDRLPPGQQLVARGKWPAIGERSPAAGQDPWTLTIAGLVAEPRTFSITDLKTAFPVVERQIDIHCVTRWSKLDGLFRGLLLTDILATAFPLPASRFVSFVARSDRSHSTSLPLVDACSLGILLAFEFDGRPLAAEHGGPLRVVVPGRYFYKSLKWLERIELLADDSLGYWEQSAGYHNHADPWQEERYLAPGLSKQQMQAILDSRDISDRDMLGLEAAGRDLTGINARGATIRNANFRSCRLAGSIFEGANLSNAHFDGADLQGANFLNADVEGASFAGANLRDADFTGAALTAATFQSARLDGARGFTSASLDLLTPDQADYVRHALGASLPD